MSLSNQNDYNRHSPGILAFITPEGDIIELSENSDILGHLGFMDSFHLKTHQGRTRLAQYVKLSIADKATV